jgi:hypothetical protein
MHGQTVCRMHGGSSPQALKAAEERLRALVHPAISGLASLIDHADSDSVRLSAIKDVLDRAGYRPSVQVQGEQEIVITIRREDQPISVENAYRAITDGRTHD